MSARGFRRNDRADEWLEAARLSFSSADAAVARVDDEGRITAVAVGETDVISSADGGAQGSAFDMTHVVVALEAPKVIALPKVAAKVAQKVKAAAPKKAGKK